MLVLRDMVEYIMTAMLLVTNSTLVRMTRTKPTGNTKAASIVARPGLVERRPPAPPATMRSNMEPREMNMPPKMDLRIKSAHGRAALATPDCAMS